MSFASVDGRLVFLSRKRYETVRAEALQDWPLVEQAASRIVSTHARNPLNDKAQAAIVDAIRKHMASRPEIDWEHFRFEGDEARAELEHLLIDWCTLYRRGDLIRREDLVGVRARTRRHGLAALLGSSRENEQGAQIIFQPGAVDMIEGSLTEFQVCCGATEVGFYRDCFVVGCF